MSVKTVSTTYACDWVLEQSPEPLVAPTYCSTTITVTGHEPMRVESPHSERDLFQWLFVVQGSKPDRHFCGKHAPLVKQMGLAG